MLVLALRGRGGDTARVDDSDSPIVEKLGGDLRLLSIVMLNQKTGQLRLCDHRKLRVCSTDVALPVRVLRGIRSCGFLRVSNTWAT